MSPMRNYRCRICHKVTPQAEHAAAHFACGLLEPDGQTHCPKHQMRDRKLTGTLMRRHFLKMTPEK